MAIKQLEETAVEVRQNIIQMLIEAGSGHSAGPLGIVDVLVGLYFEVMSIDPKDPTDSDRDRFLLSAGHLAPALYAVMSKRGYFPKSALSKLRKFGSPLQGHPHNLELPGIEISSGPLGQGLSQGIGFALAARLDQKKWQTYVLLSDGEHNEGQTWEAIMTAAKYHLHNLTAIVDRNNIQIDGFTEDIMPLEPLAAKYQDFGWHVLEVDGHNFEDIIGACRQARSIFEQPTVIIAHTIPGKGVDFMESDWRWHGAVPNDRQAKQAMRELRSLQGKIESIHD